MSVFEDVLMSPFGDQLRAAPGDRTARGVFADYLDDANDPGATAVAALIRLMDGVVPGSAADWEAAAGKAVEVLLPPLGERERWKVDAYNPFDQTIDVTHVHYRTARYSVRLVGGLPHRLSGRFGALHPHTPDTPVAFYVARYPVDAVELLEAVPSRSWTRDLQTGRNRDVYRYLPAATGEADEWTPSDLEGGYVLPEWEPAGGDPGLPVGYFWTAAGADEALARAVAAAVRRRLNSPAGADSILRPGECPGAEPSE